MKQNKTFRLMAWLVACLLPLTAWSADSAPASASKSHEAGVHYEVLEAPVRPRNADKIEVVEVFWYGCPHCYHFEPLVNKWKESLAGDIDFWRSPAVWNANMKLHAQAFYTAQALGAGDKLHEPLFVALVNERKRLASQAEIAELFTKHGVDRAAFDKAFTSFGVVSQVNQADARARSFKITGTPELVVAGKYRVDAKMAGGQAQMLDVVNHLIEKERAARQP